jgi:hypothetical protein
MSDAGKDASFITRRMKARTIYANSYINQRSVESGNLFIYNIESGTGANNSASTRTQAFIGCHLTSATQKEAIRNISCGSDSSTDEPSNVCEYNGTEFIRNIYTTVGTTTWTTPCSVTDISYLIVGGGGGSGGGYDTGGGGGGGGGMVLTGNYSVVPGTTYTIIVGDGGAGGISIRSPVSETRGLSGQYSAFDTIIALGGEGGYPSRSAPGGGSIGGLAANPPLISAAGGNGGGNAGDGNGAGGGGGGSIGDASNGVSNIGGAGGVGTSSSIIGSTVIYGTGGAGANGNSGITGTTNVGVAGASNTGNGARGGGGASSQQNNGAKGGSGIVVITYYQ